MALTTQQIQQQIDEDGGELAEVKRLVPWEKNPRLNDIAADKLAEFVASKGWGAPVLVQRGTNRIIGGHTRWKAAKKLGLERVPVRYRTCDDKTADALALADNKLAEVADWHAQGVAEVLSQFSLEEAEQLGWDAKALEDLAAEVESFGPLENEERRPGALAERFGAPPFSILDAKQGYWLERKRAWLSLGIRSEEGRGDNLLQMEYIDTGPGASVFDPVLCELMYSWFSPPGAQILDPFAGGSVRGIVAAALGRRYWGCELRPEQVAANRANAAEVLPRLQASATREQEPEGLVEDPAALTPVEQRGDFWLKRDDLFAVGGVRGGKVRTCLALSQGAEGLVTAGSRQSPRVNIVAHIARHLGVPCHVHTPSGEGSPETDAAIAAGAVRHEEKPGHNNVIVARARENAERLGWTEIPFGMECQEAAEATSAQVVNLPTEARRLVVPVGSGMSLSGILHGLRRHNISIPVLGVCVGADPRKRLKKYAPAGWEGMVELVQSDQDYHEAAPVTVLEGVTLDPVYEAKCIPFLEPGDCLWCVGIRQTTTAAPLVTTLGTVDWHEGDSAVEVAKHGPRCDFLFSCPPYGDLEVYSDLPNDISNMEHAAFLAAYRSIIHDSCKKLEQDRFAVFVVGDYRGQDGAIVGFVPDTIRIFEEAGLRFYNEMVLATRTGSAGLRAQSVFGTHRKVVKVHQSVLVFVKGDPKRAAEACKAGNDAADTSWLSEGQEDE